MKVKVSEIRAKDPKDLKLELEALQKEELNLKMQRGFGQTPKLHTFKQVRRNIARIKTILNEKMRKSHE
jgi:large subunit ribosomal protein L29